LRKGTGNRSGGFDMFYRIYPFRADGHISQPVEAEIASDQLAVNFAEYNKLPHGYEIWQFDRRVACKTVGSPVQTVRHA
jgi:hypothetical protein